MHITEILFASIIKENQPDLGPRTINTGDNLLLEFFIVHSAVLLDCLTFEFELIALQALVEHGTPVVSYFCTYIEHFKKC